MFTCETFFLGAGTPLAFGVLVPDAQLSLSASLSGEAGVLGIAARLPLPPSGDNEDRFLGERGDCFLDNLSCDLDLDFRSFDRDLDLDLDFPSFDFDLDLDFRSFDRDLDLDFRSFDLDLDFPPL